MLRHWPIVGSVVLLGMLAPGTDSTPPSGPPPSCKPAVPLAVTLQPLGSGRWQLQCSSLDRSRDVTVWMWAGSEDERREVWRGQLRPGASQVIDVGFTAPDATSPVWAAVEAFSPEGDGMRSMACVSPRGTAVADIAAQPPGELITDPATGEKILQFTGQPEAGR